MLIKRLKIKAKEPQPAVSVVPKKAKAKPKAVRRVEDGRLVDYSACNLTELLALARAAGLQGLSAAATRDMLTEALENDEHLNMPNPLEATKNHLAGWMKRYWVKVRIQTPENVFELLDKSDHQVAYYYLKNKDQLT